MVLLPALAVETTGAWYCPRGTQVLGNRENRQDQEA
jgi:hypothetical protein